MASMFHDHIDLGTTDDPDVARSVILEIDEVTLSSLSFAAAGWTINPFPNMSLEATVSSTTEKNGQCPISWNGERLRLRPR